MTALSTFLLLTHSLLGSASIAAPTAPSRIRLARSAAGRWRFVRDGVPLPFIIGLNHFSGIMRCDTDDEACLKANLFSTKYGSNASKAASAALADFESWRFTAAGYNAPPEHMAKLPFFAACFTLANATGGDNPWRPQGDVFFPDPWDLSATTRSLLEDRIALKCKAVAPYRHNLLGYLWTDFPLYDIRKAQGRFSTDYVTSLRRLDARQPGRRVYYTAFLRETYGTVPALCAAYGLGQNPACTSASWETLDLAGEENMRIPAMLADDYRFLPHIVNQLWARAYNATRACDPDGLIFGDTIVREWAGPMRALLPVAARYVDGLSIQPHGGMTDGSGGKGSGGFWNRSDWASFHAVVAESAGRDMPMIIADLGFAFPHPPYNTFEWHEYVSQEEAAAAYSSWVTGAANTSFIVGFNKCEYIDRVQAQPVPGLKPGMLDFDGKAHEPFASRVAAANERAVRIDLRAE